MEEQKALYSQHNKFRTVLWVALAILITAVITGSIFYYWQNSLIQNLKFEVDRLNAQNAELAREIEKIKNPSDIMEKIEALEWVRKNFEGQWDIEYPKSWKVSTKGLSEGYLAVSGRVNNNEYTLTFSYPIGFSTIDEYINQEKKNYNVSYLDKVETEIGDSGVMGVKILNINNGHIFYIPSTGSQDVRRIDIKAKKKVGSSGGEFIPSEAEAVLDRFIKGLRLEEELMLPKINKGDKVYIFLADGNGFDPNRNLIKVRTEAESQTDYIRAALGNLFRIKELDYGMSGLKNMLYQSDLEVRKAVKNSRGSVIIDISGEFITASETVDALAKGQIIKTIEEYTKDYMVRFNGSFNKWECLGDASGLCK